MNIHLKLRFNQPISFCVKGFKNLSQSECILCSNSNVEFSIRSKNSKLCKVSPKEHWEFLPSLAHIGQVISEKKIAMQQKIRQRQQRTQMMTVLSSSHDYSVRSLRSILLFQEYIYIYNNKMYLIKNSWKSSIC